VFWAVLTVYCVVALGLLGVRYWVLPRADQWRPQIEAYASKALGSRVTIGSIQANWQGLNPKLDLTSVQVYDDEVDPVLSLPSVSAVLAWRSILVLSPKLLRLQLDRPELLLRRDPTWTIQRCAGWARSASCASAARPYAGRTSCAARRSSP
jgi:uncharacterized protein YhdP